MRSPRALRALAMTLLTNYLLLTPLHGAFETVGAGGRPTAMANAFTAIGEDTNAIYFNPAGLATLRGPELTSMYSQLFTGLSDKSNIGVFLLGYGQPLKDGKWGTVGFGLWRLSLESLFAEQSLAMSYGRFLRNVLSGKLYVGGNAKMLSRSFGTTPETQNAINLSGFALGEPDPVLAQGRSKTGISLDLGAYYKYNVYTFGLAINNINQPNMALSSNDKDVVPMTIRLGATMFVAGTRFAMDLNRKEAIQGRFDNTLALALEKTLTFDPENALSLRGGFAYGDRSLRNLHLGLGYQFHRAIFNYAFQMPLGGIESVNGSHALSFSVRFGRAMVTEGDLGALLEAEKEARARAEASLEKTQSAYKSALDRLGKIDEELAALRKAQEQKPVAPTQRELTPEQKRLEELEKSKHLLEQQMREEKTKELEGQQAVIQAFKLSWNYYQKAVDGGAGYPERLKILADIEGKYAGKGIDIGIVVREKDNVKKEFEQVQQDFNFSWNYYQQLAASGVSNEAKLELLNRMVKKFSNKGIDLGQVQGEIEKLKR